MSQKRKRILIIDDSPTVIKMLQIVLESKDYEVITAYDGETGLKKVYSDKPDIVILDIMLPDIDGYEVCERIKNNANSKDIPVIMLTAKDMGEDFNKAMEKKADWYIVKPYDVEHLIRVINTLTEEPGSEDEL